MSKLKAILASHVVTEHFGEMVNKVSSHLLQNGRKTLKELTKALDLTREEVKKSILILIQHNIVTYSKNKASIVEYHVELETILKRKRYQRYVYGAKSRFGDVAELVIESILLNGSDILSRVSKVVAERLDDESGEAKPDEQLVIRKCKDLINGHFLMRVKNPNIEEKEQLEEQEQENYMYAIPEGIGVKRKLDKSPSSNSKRMKLDESSCTDQFDQSNSKLFYNYGDEGVYWHVNFDRFDQMFLDQMIIDAAAERLDQSASKIVATILKMTEMERTMVTGTTRSISVFDIIKKMTSIPRLEQQEVQQYLSLLSDEKTGGFVSKTDDAGGGMYSVDIKRSVGLICQFACATVVQERFGSKACRVFRLLIQKKLLEQKQIGELAMIPFKEVKELLYKLFEERFIKIQEVSKASDYAPSRTFYLFGVDMPQVSRLLLSRCYQAIGNLMARRKHEMEENKRLLEKNEKIEGILAALSSSNEDSEQVIQELEELITPTEKQQLEKLKIDLARLEQGEIQVEETVFILQNYITHH